MTLIILAEAEVEYRQAARWYESQQMGVGDRFLNEFERVLGEIEADPTRFPLLETTSHSKRQFRRAILHRFPYYVVFEVIAEEIRIVAVPHGRQRPNYWLDRT